VITRLAFVLWVLSVLFSSARGATPEEGAAHPNAGKLLISFVPSAEGQRMLRDQGRIPGHREVEPQVFSLPNVKLQASDPRQAKDYGPAGEEMLTIFGSR
jgi:hypothetical protein